MRYIIILLCGMILMSCRSKKSIDNSVMRLNEIEFQSIFGTKDKKENEMYCLLGSGFFLTPRSANSDSLVNNWIIGHPNAKVIPVSSFGPISTNQKDSRITYIMVVAKKDTLNNYLIKQGCFPGGTMMYNSINNFEIAEEFEDLFDETEHFEKFYIQGKVYENYINQIKVAEEYARTNKLGIWADDFKSR